MGELFVLIGVPLDHVTVTWVCAQRLDAVSSCCKTWSCGSTRDRHATWMTNNYGFTNVRGPWCLTTHGVQRPLLEPFCCDLESTANSKITADAFLIDHWANQDWRQFRVGQPILLALSYSKVVPLDHQGRLCSFRYFVTCFVVRELLRTWKPRSICELKEAGKRLTLQDGALLHTMIIASASVE